MHQTTPNHRPIQAQFVLIYWHNRSVTTITRTKLNTLLTQVGPGTPLTSEDLAQLGISADLAVHYVKAGWLDRLARGVFRRCNDVLQLHPSLLLLQSQLPGLHVGGKTALDWWGMRQYVAAQPVLYLYGWKAGTLPGWFTQRFPGEYHRKRLFKEEPSKPLHVAMFRDSPPPAAQVSSPERAFLELLNEVGKRQPLQEVMEIAESTYSFRAEVLDELLQHCTSVKTVRLCLQLGRDLSLPWAKKLDPTHLPTGGKSRWVSNQGGNLLILQT